MQISGSQYRRSTGWQTDVDEIIRTIVRTFHSPRWWSVRLNWSQFQLNTHSCALELYGKERCYLKELKRINLFALFEEICVYIYVCKIKKKKCFHHEHTKGIRGPIRGFITDWEPLYAVYWYSNETIFARYPTGVVSKINSTHTTRYTYIRRNRCTACDRGHHRCLL